ncbi:hypothetical protein [Microcoleus sp. FACHB-68]|uniref:hypothetical protein n=1 Tax=Microcoleus sp. FACHB-68 TaxID=2692826 RepID=UPI001688658A|nr:hypothetical protein [Microcoleus sp. FACHB-68]MBD1936377.1 hypothetical protein [Microcoleus sp. FACHB-68]
MSKNLSPQSPIQPLSIGNVVSAGVRIYRSHLKSYLGLALQGSLWVMLPLVLLALVSVFPAYFQANPLATLVLVAIGLVLLIYGLAKYYAFSALISRLAFGELVNQPESVTTAKSKINSRLGSFLSLNIQIGLLLSLVYLGLAITAGIVIGIVASILGSVIGRIGIALVVFLMVFIILFGLTWFFARWLIAEVPLAVEEGTNTRQSIDRSWELSKNSAFRIQGIVLIGFLVTVPLVLVTNYLPLLFLVGVEPNSPRYWIVYFISLITGLLGSALVLPFWQAIKAVLYYDLRSRREGLGLKLRDREV